MSDYVKRMTADNYCDFCRTNLEGYNHEDWCPIVEIEKLRAALRSWLRSNDAMEWLDGYSPLVRQTREALDE